MKWRMLASVLATGLLLAPLAVAMDDKDNPKKIQKDDEMAQAIAFEHHKDVAAARQARMEARHPSVPDSASTADRSVDRDDTGSRVKDPGPKKQ